jgi:hypothetical protein
LWLLLYHCDEFLYNIGLFSRHFVLSLLTLYCIFVFSILAYYLLISLQQFFYKFSLSKFYVEVEKVGRTHKRMCCRPRTLRHFALRISNVISAEGFSYRQFIPQVFPIFTRRINKWVQWPKMKYQLKGFAKVLKFVGKGEEMRKDESCKIKGVKSLLPPHCFAATV